MAMRMSTDIYYQIYERVEGDQDQSEALDVDLSPCHEYPESKHEASEYLWELLNSYIFNK